MQTYLHLTLQLMRLKHHSWHGSLHGFHLASKFWYDVFTLHKFSAKANGSSLTLFQSWIIESFCWSIIFSGHTLKSLNENSKIRPYAVVVFGLNFDLFKQVILLIALTYQNDQNKLFMSTVHYNHLKFYHVIKHKNPNMIFFFW